MPSKGYATVGLKPSIINRLQDITDKNYPGMFLPSTLIIMMNEVKKGYYSVESHNIKLDLTGHYNTITIRSDIQEWLEKNQEKLGEEYEKKYRAKCFTKFVSYFIVNLLESKYEANNRSINLKESDFIYLQKEYQRHKEFSHEGLGFEKFVDDYINELFGKIKATKEILTI
jgi:hypothetical protein